MNMLLLSDRLRYAVQLKSERERGRRIFRTEIAKNAGVTSPTVSYWMEDRYKMKAENARRLASWLGVDPIWLETGKGAPVPDDINVEPAADVKGLVPVISWVQAGMFTDPHCTLEVGDAYEYVSSTVQVRENTFALRVQGDSMTPDFPPGMILIVEPSMTPEIGDYVIAKNGDAECTFKKLVKDGADWYLKPNNPAYPIKPLGDSIVVGVVREAIIKLK